MELTNKLYYNNLTFYHVGYNKMKDRVYRSLDNPIHYNIITSDWDYDGVLICEIDRRLGDEDEEDYLRYFDAMTGKEEDYGTPDQNIVVSGQ